MLHEALPEEVKLQKSDQLHSLFLHPGKNETVMFVGKGKSWGQRGLPVWG